MRRLGVSISLGDPAGIGPEVLAKSLKAVRRGKDTCFYVHGDGFLLKRLGLASSENVRIIDLNCLTPRLYKPGRPNKASAKASLSYLDSAVSYVKAGIAQCLVTGPISKERVARVGFPWSGHTEFLASVFRSKGAQMVFVRDQLKVVLLTRHLSLRQALKFITKKKLLNTSALLFALLTEEFGIRRPKIAVCGLNPHAGEGGLFGREETLEIIPAIASLNRKFGRHFFGPLAPDTVFHQACAGAFDLVVALYHDQGLIPFKMVAFEDGVNLTAGLPFIRTSPVHGTAYGIAGKGAADHRSMRNAIELACRLTRNRLRRG